MAKQQIVKIDEATVAKLEEIADACGLKTLDSHGRFAKAFKLSAGIEQLRGALTDSVMAEIMPLQNTALGFHTDKNPSTAKAGQVVDPYPVAVVRDCLIEATLRGVFPVNNEFNIISARAYITKNGFARLVREYPGLTNLRLNPGVPKIVGEKGALVPFTASWHLDGNPDNLERLDQSAQGGHDERIPVRVNYGMGADAIIGKATRKMLAAIYGRLTGSDYAVVEGEVEEAEFRKAKPVTATATIPRNALSPGDPASHEGHPEPGEKPKPAAKPAAKKAEPKELSMAQKLHLARNHVKEYTQHLPPDLLNEVLDEAGIIEGLDKCEDLGLLQIAENKAMALVEELNTGGPEEPEDQDGG